MTTQPQDPTHRRSATRAPVGRPIKLQFDDSMDVIEGTCRDVSIGGMFIVFEDSRPAGSLVRFELELEDDSAIRGLGEVVWMRSKTDFKGPEAGFGLKFRFLEQRDRQLIFKLVSRHIKERLTHREPAAELAAAAADPLRATIAVPPEPEPAAAALPEPVAAPLPEPEPVAAPPPESLASPPESDLLPFDLDELDLETPAPQGGPPAADRAWDDLEPDFSPEEAGFSLERERGAPAERSRARGIAGDEMLSPDLGSFAGDAADLDLSAGDTPFYELGLDPEPPSAPQTTVETAFDEPPPPLTSPQTSYLAPESAGEAEVGERPRGSYAASAAAPARRELSMLPVLGVLLVTAAAVGYLFKDELLARFGGGETPTAESVAAALPEAAEGGAPVEAEPASPPPEEPPPATTATPLAATPLPVPVPPPPTAAPPPPSTAPAPPPSAAVAAAVPPPAASSAASGGFTRLLDVSWSEAGGGLQVTLTADGAIPEGRYRYFHLGGDAPREVIKLLGARQSFRRSQLDVDGPGVRRIRTGFHQVEGGNEQHVVIDLLGPRWKITEIRSVGSRLELTIVEE